MQRIQSYDVTFGDCDPAGIVFYPNIFRWMDASFHSLLRVHGGHSELCEQLGAVGLGLVDAAAQFKNPIRDGDRLNMHIGIEEWSDRTFTLHYEGRLEDRLAFAGREIRCLFKRTQQGIVAANLAQLREILESPNV